ncbi:hypothetical protein [Companilactobacillus keshanensis]|uniref:Uncharacterized protein n=1 Tax=Companilactobacillus keshanensis TaxID=2486003 RepID=A0ABW4BUR0_9LACO|nr:hypothetical protein [Companilactobacillus keshanensis]
MSLADKVSEGKMLLFKCSQCNHPAMLILKKKELGTNPDNSVKYEITMQCPRCRNKDGFTLNDGKIDVASKSEKTDKVPNLDRVL